MVKIKTTTRDAQKLQQKAMDNILNSLPKDRRELIQELRAEQRELMAEVQKCRQKMQETWKRLDNMMERLFTLEVAYAQDLNKKRGGGNGTL